MEKEQIKAIQAEIGVDPDGRFGDKSRRAAINYLNGLAGFQIRRMTAAQREREYGKPGDETSLIRIDVKGLGVMYDGKTVNSIKVHKLCADSLLAIIKELSTFDEGREQLSKYAGCYNPRMSRTNSSEMSTHAWGMAIDLHPSGNGNRMTWPNPALMPWSVIKVFAKNGWLSAAVWWGRDAMHFEFNNA